MKFYPRKWANYDLALTDALRLMPPSFRFPELKSDYFHMRNMIFGRYPTFEEMLEEIEALEKEINGLRNKE